MMFSLLALTTPALAAKKTLGPCFLYDRYCLETIWQPEISQDDRAFGINLLNQNWRTQPELHNKKCMDVPRCKVSGYALVCRENGTRDNVTEQYKKKYVIMNTTKDNSVVRKFLAPLEESDADICVTLEAKVGALQGNKEGERIVEPEGVDDGAVLISDVGNIKNASNCNTTDWKNAPAVDAVGGGCAAVPLLAAFLVIF